MDVYIRVSRTGERTEEESTERYEAQCRDWAERNGFDVDEVVEDTDVSGSVAVADRGLERLIQRVEAGESDGILTPYLDRFGRDLIEGALAYKRIQDAGGRLVCVRDGLDSHRQGDKLQFNVRMTFAEDYLDRVKENWTSVYEGNVARGQWLAPKVPFGYRKDEEKRLRVVEAEAAIVRELFRRRADGENQMALTRWMRERCAEADLERGAKVTRTGVRSILGNEVYLGKTTYARGRKDNPIVKETHDPIVTEHEWEAAQIKQEFSPRNGRAAGAKLRGLVFCASCGHRCKVGASGRARKGKVPTYICTNLACEAHAGILASKLDGYVDVLLTEAAMLHEPHVEAILLGDTRYQDAMEAVEDAKRALEEYRDNVELQREIGIQSFTEGLRARKRALDLARGEARKARPSRRRRLDLSTATSFEEAESMLDREQFERYVAKVVLRPTGDGRPQPADQRADVYWIGSEEPWEADYETVREHLAATTPAPAQAGEPGPPPRPLSRAG